MSKKRVRDKKIEFYVTMDELKTIDKKASICKLDRSKYLRKSAMENQIINIDLSYLDKLIYEINKIGVNINQIAKVSNSNQYIYNSELKEINQYMDMIWKKISNVF